VTHLDDLHALLSERAHLRAQRDELQATCTRLEAEARAAREEMRRVRAKQPSVGDILHGTAILGRRVTIPGVGSGRIISFSAYGDDEAGCQIRLDGRRGVRPDVPAKDLHIEDEPAAITPPAEQGDIANRTTVADMLKDNNSPVGRRVQITVNGPRLGTVLAMQERATGNVCIVQTGEGAFEMHEPHTLVDAEPTFDRKEWLDRFFSRNRELMAALAKAEREEREAKPAPEQPAAITPPAERGDIEPETVADLLALGRPVVGLHVTVPSFMHSDRTVPRVVKDIVKLHDGTRCAVVRDDFGELLHKPENVRLAKPTPEEKTAHVARWMHVRVDAWQLVSTRGLLATMTVNHSETDPFRAFIGTDRVDGRTAIACAGWAEDYLRRSGMLPTGPIDRSALNELRREVDPSTHNAARMATLPHLSATLRRRGHAPSDGTRRRWIRGQRRWHQPDRHR